MCRMADQQAALRPDRRGLRHLVVARAPRGHAAPPRRGGRSDGRRGTADPGRGLRHGGDGRCGGRALAGCGRGRGGCLGRDAGHRAPGAGRARRARAGPRPVHAGVCRPAAVRRRHLRRRASRPSCCSWSRPGRGPCARCGACSGPADAWRTSGGCRATRRLAADAAYDEALRCRRPGAARPRQRPPRHGVARRRDRPAAPRRVPGRDGARDRLEHEFTPEGFAGFITRFDDEDLFASMEPGARAVLEADLLRRLRALPPDGLRLVLPIVYASGRRG